MSTERIRTIITGASSGIGEGLAKELGRRGHAVALLARRKELLDALVVELAKSGVQAVALRCDVTDSDAVHAAVREGEQALGGAFDYAIANAGVSGLQHATKFKLAEAEQMLRINLFGMLYLFDAVIPSMVARGSGSFSGIASLAGIRGLPSASVYSASKSAMQTFLEANRVELAPYGVRVTTVNPGFVATPMTAGRKGLPCMMDLGESVAIIADGIEQGARIVEFPRPISLLLRLSRFVPSSLFDKAVARYGRLRTSQKTAAAALNARP